MMPHILEVVSIISTMLLMASEAQADCVVNTTLGVARGFTMTTHQGRDICTYRGLPFAAPPVGDLRFRNPEPAQPWTGEFDATKDGKQCMQGMLSIYLGDEDCLYLNVHTTQTAEPSGALLPVLVFIHGGAFIFGNGNPTEYGPLYMLDKDIVMVSMNYRLGVLGFLSTGDDAAPGNYGLKDQVEALRWVQKNIAAFGGDPNRVTIMGESAGAMSVHYHVLSPLSKGLFHGAIADSGSVLLPVLRRQGNQIQSAQQQAEAVGCPTDTSENLINCLRELDIGTLMSKQIDGCTGSSESIFFCLFDVMWRPTDEVQTEANPEPFMPAPSQDIINSGDFNHVPFLLGTNANEGSMFLIMYVGTQAGLDNMNANFERLGKGSFFLQESVAEELIPDTWNKIADFYLGNNHTVTPANVQKMIDAATDRYMQHNIQKSVEMHLAAGHDSIYFYNFAYKGKYSFLTKARYGDARFDLGVLHIDELEYSLSHGDNPNNGWESDHPDLEVLDAMVTLWTNFVIHGNPTPPEETAPQSIVWPTAGSNSAHITYYVFGHAEPPTEPIHDVMPLHISVAEDIFKERMDFWDSLPLKENEY